MKFKCKKKKENSLFSIYDSLHVKLLTGLRLQFSHLNEHKLGHGFGDTSNGVCVCESEVEPAELFLLRCYLYSPQRLELFEKLQKVDSSFLNLNLEDKVSFLLYGSQSATTKNFNQDIRKFVINYIKEIGRFDEPLFGPNQ